MSDYQLRRFTKEGIDVVQSKLERLAIGETVDLTSILTDDEITEVIAAKTVLRAIKFSNRMECGKYFFDLIEENQSSIILDPEKDKGLWTWLAILWYPQLIRPGNNPVGEMSRWIPSTDFRRYYRHLLAGPYFVYKAHSDDPSRAWALLCTEVSKPGEVYEQVIGYRNMIRFPSIVGTVTRLYYEPKTNGLKRGAAGKSEGSARRFSAVLRQFELTYDFYGMGVDQILELLPREFDRFRKA